MARAIRWGAALLAALVIGALLAAFALSYGWQRAWLTEQIEASASSALGRRVLIGSIEGVLHNEFTLSGVEVAGTAAPLAEMDAIDVRIESFAFRTEPGVVLAALHISGASFDVRQAEGGSWSWQDELAEPAEEAPSDSDAAFRIGIRSLLFREASARIQLRDQVPLEMRFDAELEGIELGPSTEMEQGVASFEIDSEEIGAESRIGGRLAGSYLAGEWVLAALEAESDQISLSAKGAGDAEHIREARLVAEIASLGAFARRTGRPGSGGSNGAKDSKTDGGDTEDIDETSAADHTAHADATQYADFGFEGAVELSADFSGSYDWPLGTLLFEGEGLKARGNEIGNIRLKVHATEPGRVEIDALSLDRGEMGWVASEGAVLTVVDDLAMIENLVLRRRRGSSALRLAATLPIVSAEGDPMRDARTRVELVSTQFQLEALSPLWNVWELEAWGELDSNLRVRGAASGPKMTGILNLASSGFSSGTTRVEGVDLKVDVDGTLQNPSASIVGTMRRVATAEQEWGGLSVAAQLAENEATFERLAMKEGPLDLRLGAGSRVAWSGEQIRFDDFEVIEGNQKMLLQGALSRDRAHSLEVELDSLEPARIAARLRAFGLMKEEGKVGGRIDGRLFFSGSRHRPEMRGNLDWSNPQLDEYRFDAIHATIGTEGESVRIATDWERGARSVATIRATLPRSQILVTPEALVRNPQSRIQAQLDRFELGSLSPFLPPAISMMRGRLSASLDAYGGPLQPDLKGDLTLEEGGLKLRALGGQTLAPIGVQALLHDGAIEIEQFRIGQGEQRVDGQATLQFDGFTPSEIDSRLTFLSFPVDAPGLVKGTLSGPLVLRGKPAALDLTGSLEVGELLVRIPDPGDSTLKEIRIISTDTDAPPEFREEGDARSLLDPLKVSVDVRLAKNSWARGRGAEIELRGNLNAAKEREGALRLSGEVKTVRGTYEVYGRRFRIERGEVALDGGLEADPVLDIRALHRVRGVKIYALIEGRLSEPRLRFESDPELDETDIASYLLLGRPASGSAGDDQIAVEAVAAQVAVGAAIREFEKMFGGALPVDLIDIRMDNEGDERTLRAGVGKYIGERLFLHYERGFGDEPEDELKAEYELTPSWSVESTVSTDGDTAGDLVFEIEY